MKFKDYVKDNLPVFIIHILIYLLTIWLLYLFQVDFLVFFLISFFTILSYISYYTYDFWRKKKFFDSVFNNLESLDKKYLLPELIETADFYDGICLNQILYECNKSMNEHLKEYERRLQEFKEYIELWIHEIKIPISGGLLLLHNHQKGTDKKLEESFLKIENYIEQVLYYARGEHPEKDYYIHKANLKQIVNQIAIKNQDSFIYRKIKLQLENLDTFVYTDSKWLEFILNQIVQNSIKYCDKEDSVIQIKAVNKNDTVFLIIKDNGIGIPLSEIPRVFDKSFTGTNGRKIQTSTGMGLFICKNLCHKLGHQLLIDSKINEYTIVTIVFGKDNYYNVIKEDE